MSNRIIAIGDIHGCSKALDAVLFQIKVRPEDWIIPLGDVIDRGPDSRVVVEQLIELEKRCRVTAILGNHEEVLLAVRDGKTPLLTWISFGGGPTLESYQCEGNLHGIPKSHMEFFERMVSYLETPTHMFIHANYLPLEPLDRTPEFVLRWESLRERVPEPHISGKTAILGHTSQISGNVLDLGYLKCIDTYCAGGGWLTALDVTTGRIWQANNQGEMDSLAFVG